MADPQAIYEHVLEFAEDHRFEEALSALTYLEGEIEPNALVAATRARLLLALDRLGDAEHAAREAIALDPGLPGALYAGALVALVMKEPALAIERARQARALDAEWAEPILVEARANLLLGRPARVEALAAEARALDPASDDAATLFALMREVRAGGGDQSVDWDAIADRFPLDPIGRTGRAWSLLRKGQARAAEQEFRQALTLDGSSEWARHGLVLALKTRFPGYGLLLRGLLALGTMPPRQRFFVFLGGIFAFRLTRSYAKENPEMMPVLAPLMAAYVLFVLGSWIADPLLNLALLASKEGRQLVTGEDRQGAMLVGGVLGLGIAFGIAALVGWQSGLVAAVGLVASSLAFAAAYQVEEHKRTGLLVSAAVLTACAIASAFITGGMAAFLVVLPILGAVISTWVASAINLRAEARLRR